MKLGHSVTGLCAVITLGLSALSVTEAVGSRVSDIFPDSVAGQGIVIEGTITPELWQAWDQVQPILEAEYKACLSEWNIKDDGFELVLNGYKNLSWNADTQGQAPNILKDGTIMYEVIGDWHNNAGVTAEGMLIPDGCLKTHNFDTDMFNEYNEIRQQASFPATVDIGELALAGLIINVSQDAQTAQLSE